MFEEKIMRHSTTGLDSFVSAVSVGCSRLGQMLRQEEKINCKKLCFSDLLVFTGFKAESK